jgi:ferric-dicitrate binding protein FerR (iron transport regulator)
MEQQQMEAAFRASDLIFQYLGGTILPGEQAELDAWLAASENNRLLFAELTNPPQFNELLTHFSYINKRKATARRKLRRRLSRYKIKILRLTARIWRYVA